MIILISAKPQLLYDKHIKQQESLPKLDSSIDRGTSFNFKPGHIQAYTICSQTDHGVDIGGRIIQWRH
ncbi:hypothetical protein P8452_00307 [Trifolium repens]|nr:hypothetical protein P8452_00307 [Trifolium repens]